MAGTSTVAVGSAAYTSLGTGPMLISPQQPVQIVAAASQPAVGTAGHMINAGPLLSPAPFYFSLSEQVWALAPGGATNVVVTV